MKIIYIYELVKINIIKKLKIWAITRNIFNDIYSNNDLNSYFRKRDLNSLKVTITIINVIMCIYNFQFIVFKNASISMQIQIFIISKTYVIEMYLINWLLINFYNVKCLIYLTLFIYYKIIAISATSRLSFCTKRTVKLTFSLIRMFCITVTSCFLQR